MRTSRAGHRAECYAFGAGSHSHSELSHVSARRVHRSLMLARCARWQANSLCRCLKAPAGITFGDGNSRKAQILVTNVPTVHSRLANLLHKFMRRRIYVPAAMPFVAENLAKRDFHAKTYLASRGLWVLGWFWSNYRRQGCVYRPLAWKIFP